jgi:Kef-type K+ transport system membrane component KefB
VVFFFIFLYLGLKVIDKILNLGERIHLPKAFLSISLSIFLIVSFFASAFGIAGIIGAFVAGLLIGNTLKSRKIIDDVRAIGYGFFIPLFFIWVGAQLWSGASTNLSTYTSIGLLTLMIIFVAIIGKLFGCSIGAFLSRMNKRESIQIGIGMIPRMELALIIVTSAISTGIIKDIETQHQILAATILLTIITTLITPILLKNSFHE